MLSRRILSSSLTSTSAQRATCSKLSIPLNEHKFRSLSGSASCRVAETVVKEQVDNEGNDARMYRGPGKAVRVFRELKSTIRSCYQVFISATAFRIRAYWLMQAGYSF